MEKLSRSVIFCHILCALATALALVQSAPVSSNVTLTTFSYDTFGFNVSATGMSPGGLSGGNITLSNCKGNLTSTLVVGDMIVDCLQGETTIPITCTDDVLTIFGSWTPPAAAGSTTSVAPFFSLDVTFVDSQGVSSMTYTWNFTYTYVATNQSAQFRSVERASSDPWSSALVYQFIYRLHGNPALVDMHFTYRDLDNPNTSTSVEQVKVSFTVPQETAGCSFPNVPPWKVNGAWADPVTYDYATNTYTVSCSIDCINTVLSNMQLAVNNPINAKYNLTMIATDNTGLSSSVVVMVHATSDIYVIDNTLSLVSALAPTEPHPLSPICPLPPPVTAPTLPPTVSAPTSSPSTRSPALTTNPAPSSPVSLSSPLVEVAPSSTAVFQSGPTSLSLALLLSLLFLTM